MTAFAKNGNADEKILLDSSGVVKKKNYELIYE